MYFTSINPYTEEVIQKYKLYSSETVSKIIKTSENAFNEWKETDFSNRAKLFYSLIDLLLKKKEYHAEIMMKEMGKPISTAIGEIEKCAWVCRYYAKNAEKFLTDEYIETEATESYLKFQPLGPVFAIMPWNFPYWQVLRFAAPTIMAGNTVILKHSPNVTGCALAIEALFEEAGFPKGIFSSLIIDIPEVKSVVNNPAVKGVTLTGSLAAGSSIASLAGKAVKKSVLELGGSDPYIILEDADLENAVKACVTSRLFNSGQTCISAKRFFVMEHQLKAVEELFVKEMSIFNIQNPELKDTLFGPLARKDIRDSLHSQAIKSISQGAKCILGGKIPKASGFQYTGTILTNVQKDMTVFDEETFGPVVAIIPVKSEKEAVQMANNSVFGLGGAVFTKDIERGKRIAEQLEVGFCAINDFVRSDPRLPFGGIKKSGYGREISHYGIKEFVNIKPIYIK